jgi:1-acyl-sn-glycerol-3-phosphate acyltransferase
VKTSPRPVGRILQWMDRKNRKEGVSWGTNPQEFRPEAIRSTLAGVGRLFGRGRYFDVDVAGWDHVPASPVMVVSNHSGGTTIPDVWGFLAAWYRYFGVHRPIHPMAHELILSTRITAMYFGQRGVLHGSRRLALDVLTTHQRDLMVMPGGDRDTWRPYSKRHQVCFAGRTGYAKLALQAGVPIVPVANVGAHETLFVLTDGRAVARALRLPELFRAEIFPVHLSLPWGLAVGPWPHIPLPVHLRYRIGAPVLPPEPVPPGVEPSEELIRAYDSRVQAAVQGLLDQLKSDG